MGKASGGDATITGVRKRLPSGEEAVAAGEITRKRSGRWA